MRQQEENASLRNPNPLPLRSVQPGLAYSDRLARLVWEVGEIDQCLTFDLRVLTNRTTQQVAVVDPLGAVLKRISSRCCRQMNSTTAPNDKDLLSYD